MRILIVMAGFFPGIKYGGPPVSVDNFCTLMKDHECFIVTHNHDMDDQTPYNDIKAGWNDRGNCQVLYLSDSDYSRKNFDKIINAIHPDIIYLQSFFQSCVFPCLYLARKYKLPVLLAPRGELCAGALAMKKYKKIPYIRLMVFLGIMENVHFQSTSKEETEAIKKLLKINSNNIHQLENIPSIPNKIYQKSSKESGVGSFIFLSRIHPKKNLLFAIKCFSGIPQNVTFDIYGSIEDVEYWEKCKKEISSLPKNIKVNYKGIVKHTQVHEIFSQYDAFIFPTFSENYGHVIAESLMVGTPVIISDNTPWHFKNTNISWDIDLSNQKAFIEAIEFIIDRNQSEIKEITKAVIKYAKDEMDIAGIKKLYSVVLSKIGSERL